MSALTQGESARRFCETIGIKGGALKKPQVQVAPSNPVLQPQAPEQKPPAKPDKNNFPQRMSDEMDAQVELERHPDLFADTLGGWENVQLVLDYVKTHHDNYLSRANVQDAITTLLRQGELLTLFRPEPSPVKTVPAAAPAVQQPQHVASPDPEVELPPLPDYVKRVLGGNKLRTRDDVHAIPSWLYSQIYRGPHATAFKARIDAIGRR